jgi:amino acid adenylation domain-containing protein
MGLSAEDIADTIPGRFDRVLAARAEHPAIAGTAESLSYRELGALADRYAAAVLERRRSGQHVAVLARHGAPVIAASLAALRCGMGVVTLNPSDPPARLAEIRAAVQPDLLLSDEPHLEQARAAGFAEERTVILSQAPDRAEPPAYPPVEAEDLAFLICTSGSTGVPKVVLQSHRNVLHNVLRYTNGLGIGADDRLAWLASLSGGQGIATAWTALLGGATLCPFPIAERGVTGLAGWLAEHGVTVFDTIPSVLRNFAQTLTEERIPGVRLVRIASEGAFGGDFRAFERHFAAECGLATVLASSEAGIIAQGILHPGDEVPAGALPVGRPADGIEVLLLDESGEPVADGATGEIVVESDFLSPGYLGDPELTARRFEHLDGRRRLRTGDLARRSGDGVLTVIGRGDKQVKIRGNRLQLEEVEAALADHPGIAAAAVALETGARGDARLIAYLAAGDGTAPEPGEIRRRLASMLPAHAIPAGFVFLDQLPLTPHGKVDRERLAGLRPPDQRDGSAGPLPGSETEELIAGLWSEAFERAVGSHEAFLELGGDSLTAAVIAARVHERFGVQLDLRVFASDITVSGLAALVERRRDAAPDDELPPLRRAGRTGPLSSAQERLWRPGAFDRSDPFWNVAVPFIVRGPLDVEALRASIEQIVRRHESLRTTFTERDGRPVAVVRPPERFELTVEDLRGESDPRARAAEIADAAMLEPFDLERGPLLRTRLLQVDAEEYHLVRLTHHLIHDALSWRIFFRELAVLYEAFREGSPSPLPDDPPLQYIDYAVWEQSCLAPDSRRYRSEVTWWERRLESPLPGLELPFARPQPDPEAAASKGFATWGIPAAHSVALDELGRRAGATYYMTRLAAFAALLSLESGTEEFVIGTPVSTRTRAELQSMIGLFLNFAMLRLSFSGDPSFSDWVHHVRRAVIDTSARVSIPAERLRTELRARKVELPQTEARFVAAGPSSIPRSMTRRRSRASSTAFRGSSPRSAPSRGGRCAICTRR